MRGAPARMLAHPSGSAFAESALRNAFTFLRRIYRLAVTRDAGPYRCSEVLASVSAARSVIAPYQNFSPVAGFLSPRLSRYEKQSPPMSKISHPCRAKRK